MLHWENSEPAVAPLCWTLEPLPGTIALRGTQGYGEYLDCDESDCVLSGLALASLLNRSFPLVGDAVSC